MFVPTFSQKPSPHPQNLPLGEGGISEYARKWRMRARPRLPIFTTEGYQQTDRRGRRSLQQVQSIFANTRFSPTFLKSFPLRNRIRATAITAFGFSPFGGRSCQRSWLMWGKKYAALPVTAFLYVPHIRPRCARPPSPQGEVSHLYPCIRFNTLF